MDEPKRIGTRFWGAFQLILLFNHCQQVAGQEKAVLYWW